MILLLYLVLILLFIFVIYLVFKFKKTPNESFDDYIKNEVSNIKEETSFYYDSFIKDKEITSDNATALDNIADFFVNEFDLLTENEKVKALHFLNLHETGICNQIDNLRKEQKGLILGDQYHIDLKNYMGNLYRELIMIVYPKFYLLETEQLDRLGYIKFRAISDYIKLKKITDYSLF